MNSELQIYDITEIPYFGTDNLLLWLLATLIAAVIIVVSIRKMRRRKVKQPPRQDLTPLLSLLDSIEEEHENGRSALSRAAYSTRKALNLICGIPVESSTALENAEISKKSHSLAQVLYILEMIDGTRFAKDLSQNESQRLLRSLQISIKGYLEEKDRG